MITAFTLAFPSMDELNKFIQEHRYRFHSAGFHRAHICASDYNGDTLVRVFVRFLCEHEYPEEFNHPDGLDQNDLSWADTDPLPGWSIY
jgi:hypothetical protein